MNLKIGFFLGKKKIYQNSILFNSFIISGNQYEMCTFVHSLRLCQFINKNLYPLFFFFFSDFRLKRYKNLCSFFFFPHSCFIEFNYINQSFFFLKFVYFNFFFENETFDDKYFKDSYLNTNVQLYN